VPALAEAQPMDAEDEALEVDGEGERAAFGGRRDGTLRKLARQPRVRMSTPSPL
jgi:hypothetical protein